MAHRPKFDIEDMLDKIKEILQAKLNDRVTAIEGEKTAKGKGLSGGLLTFENDAYFRQTWTNEILNRDPAIFYGVEDVAADSVADSVAQRLTLFIEVVLVDSGQTNDIDSRIHRYSRAIKEVLAESFDAISFCSKTKIETVRPVSFKLELDSNDDIKVGGVSVSTTIV